MDSEIAIRAMTEEAEGYAMLGMWHDAWEAIQSLPVEQRSSPEALRIRLRCSQGSQAWKMGVSVAEALEKGSERDREAVARFYSARAHSEVAADRMASARKSIKMACEAWPPIHIELARDPWWNTVL
ncbi:lipopolysaccharide biosynthesis regulator YciM [Haloferula luteola]|uniref:Lipopolysaccharide biosynthesis regulator YciM n=1 Tax=Haloferula luteola TaxID=595692 RepID=A0A840VBF5_9BACT|nr:hypothetical protein [Haloferula luteola]MBB5350221.1 lipopolysaccharide biosynthesis regulator YciM [Haloferula luteola]